MSDVRESNSQLGWLLLRDGDAVPLKAISPDDIKAGARHRVPNPDAAPLKHRQTLDAIVDRLGFPGDFGTFKNEGWPAFQDFLRKHSCRLPARLFPADHGGCIDLFFGATLGPKRRDLADRLFESEEPAPERVFLGYGVDWKNTWDYYRFGGRDRTIATVGGEQSTADDRADQLFERRLDLSMQWGFIDDKLLWGPVRRVIDKTYWQLGSNEDKRRAHHAQVFKAVMAFRAVFDCKPEGWVDVLRFNERLVVLRAHDGCWDILWRAYRDAEPPKAADVSTEHKLAIEDLPAVLMTKSDMRRRIHFRQEVWEEHEEHEAEQAFYDRGGTALDRQLASNADVRLAWLREQGRLPVPERQRWSGDLPPGFHLVKLGERQIAMSNLIELGTFQEMLIDTGYLVRRPDGNEPWERANEGEPVAAPVGASWADAHAFCAWKERQLGVALRLPEKDELRAIHPFYSERYARMANADFLWENYPPRPIEERIDASTSHRQDIPSALTWSEPRFLEPGPELPEFPDRNGLSIKTRKRWISDFPPRAKWRADLPCAKYSGLRFIDAWDGYEWCREPGWIHGRFWEGQIGPSTWGAYKNVKVTFRLVLDLEG